MHSILASSCGCSTFINIKSNLIPIFINQILNYKFVILLIFVVGIFLYSLIFAAVKMCIEIQQNKNFLSKYFEI